MIIRDYIFFFPIIFTLCKRTSQNPKTEPLFNELDSCECGKNNDVTPRIVGGQKVEPHLYPWMVAIFNNGRMHCGGSLINDKYILTAGHCLNWSKKEELSVILGLHDRLLMETQKKGGVIAEIEKIMVHEDFTSDYLHDTEDIGLIQLKNSVNFTTEIRPICLPKNDNDYYSKKLAIVTGWGRTSQNGDPSRYLRKANITIISNEECKKIASIGEHITDSMVCGYEHETDACQGDSGGPLVFETDSGIVEQIGIVSWGIGCAKPGVPGVYGKTGPYLEWIALHTKDAKYCKHPA